MDLTTTAFIKKALPFTKKIIDDVYEYSKKNAKFKIAEWRATAKDRNIARAIARTTHVKTLWNIEKEVSIYSFYHPAKLQFDKGIKKQVDSLKELGIVQNYVIQGTAGQGKSIFLRYLCGQELRQECSSNRIPIFVELRRIRANYNVLQLILDTLPKYGLNGDPEFFDMYAKSRRFVILLDAFDEIDPAFSQEALYCIESIAEKYLDSLQIIVTSRPNGDIQYSNRFRICKIVPLTHADHLPFLKKVCPEKGQAEDLTKVIHSSQTEVMMLLTTPLMLTLLVMLYKSIQSVPDTVPRFYEELFDVLFYRHDHSKPGFRRKRHTNLDDSRLKTLFSAFCFYVRLKRYGIVTTGQLEECFGLACKVLDLELDAKKFKDEIVKTVCLMQEEGLELSFIHKSVAEYYSASFISKSSEGFARAFYSKVLDSKNLLNWTQELRFLSQIDEYRYAKYFELPSICNIEEDFGIELDKIKTHENNELNSFFLEVLTKGSKIRFKINGDICQTNGWQRSVLDNFYLDKAAEKVLDTFGIFNQDKFPLEVIKSVNHNEELGYLLLSCPECFGIFPPGIISEAINSAFSTLREIKFNAIRNISLEEAKTSMIDELLATDFHN